MCFSQCKCQEININYQSFCFLFLPAVLTDKLLWKVANSVVDVYFQLALLLDIGAPFVKMTELNFVRDAWRVTYEVLNKWRESAPLEMNEEAMVAKLVSALSDLEKTEIAQIVQAGKCVS